MLLDKFYLFVLQAVKVRTFLVRIHNLKRERLSLSLQPYFIVMATRYGSRLMPVIVDETAEKQPNLTYASVPLTTNISDGFKSVTFSDIASAINHVAGWIDRTLGQSKNFATIAYMGLGDLRYVVVFLAAVKCGYKVCLPV